MLQVAFEPPKLPFVEVADVEVVAADVEVVVEHHIVDAADVEGVVAGAVGGLELREGALVRTPVEGHVVVAHDIAEGDAGAGDDLVVGAVEVVVHGRDVAAAKSLDGDAEAADRPGEVLHRGLELRELLAEPDLRVGDDREVVAPVVARAAEQREVARGIAGRQRVVEAHDAPFDGRVVACGDADEDETAVGIGRERVGALRLVDGNTDALSMAIGSLRSHGATVSVAESCTGGLLSMLLTERQGASEYMLGSVTSYAAAVKMNVLGVSGRVIDEEGTVSSGCAEAMADGVRRLTGSDYSVSVTGVAGPDKDEGKDVGTVYIGLSGKGRETVSVLFRFTSWGRASIRRKAATAALILLSAYIEGEDVKAIAESWGYI